MSREEGNAAFAAKRFDEAVRCYTVALESGSGTAGAGAGATGMAASERAILLGNRSAALLALGDVGGARRDAEEAVRVDASYVKGYHRLAQAVLATATGDKSKRVMWKARQVYERALGAAGKEKKKAAEAAFIVQRLEELTPKCVEEDKGCVGVEGEEHMLELFKHLGDIRSRLGLMATFWNIATKAERLVLFKRFLSLIKASEDEVAAASLGGEGPVLTEDKMFSLPMGNYDGLVFPPAFVDFFTNLESSGKLSLMEKIWESTTENERNFIVKDLQFFLTKENLGESKVALGEEEDESLN